MTQLGEVTARHRFDVERLAAHLEQHLPEFRDIRCVVKHKAPKPGEEVIINEKITEKKKIKG